MAQGQYSLDDIQTAPAVVKAGKYSFDDVQAPKEEPTTLAKVGNFVSDTLSKTAHNMSLEPVLHAVREADMKAGQGDYSGAGDELKALIPHPIDYVNDLHDKLKNGDYSGVLAGVIPLLFAKGGPEAAAKMSEVVPELARASPTAIGGFVKGATEAAVQPKSIGVHAASYAASHIPIVGPHIAAGIEAYNSLIGGIKGSKTNLAAKEQAAIQAESDAVVAAQRSNGRQSLADKAGIQAQPKAIPTEMQPIAPASATARSMTPSSAPAPETPAPVAQAPVATPTVDPAILEGVSQRLANKSYNKLNPTEKASVDNIAARLEPRDVPNTTPIKPVAATATLGETLGSKSNLLAKKLASGDKITLDDLTEAGKTNGTPSMHSVEPEDYSSLLQQSLDELKTLRKSVSNFERKKPK